MNENTIFITYNNKQTYNAVLTSPLEVCKACVGILHLFLQMTYLLLQLGLHFAQGTLELRDSLLRTFVSCWKETLPYIYTHTDCLQSG